MNQSIAVTTIVLAKKHVVALILVILLQINYTTLSIDLYERIFGQQNIEENRIINSNTTGNTISLLRNNYSRYITRIGTTTGRAASLLRNTNYSRYSKEISTTTGNAVSLLRNTNYSGYNTGISTGNTVSLLGNTNYSCCSTEENSTTSNTNDYTLINSDDDESDESNRTSYSGYIHSLSNLYRRGSLRTMHRHTSSMFPPIHNNTRLEIKPSMYKGYIYK